MLEVVNLKYYDGSSYYIGRPSIFGNPYRIDAQSNRATVIEKYRKWLWYQINREGKVRTEFLKLAELSRHEDIKLGCWCKLKTKQVACHGDVIIAAINWYNKNMALNDIDIFESNENEAFLVTGINQLDQQLGRLQDGLITLKGKAGHGKTALALQTSKDCKQSALYLSCEMAESALAQRLVARLAKIPLNNIVTKTVPADDLKAAWAFTKESTPFLTLLNGVNGYVSVDLLRDEVKKIKQRDGSNKVLVVIDSINDWLVKALPSFENLTKAELAKKLALELNDYAKEDGFTVLAILQAGRDKDVESAFDYVAETALAINFERDGREDKNGIKKANLKLEKNRVGEKATIILDFEGQFQTFIE